MEDLTVYCVKKTKSISNMIKNTQNIYIYIYKNMQQNKIKGYIFNKKEYIWILIISHVDMVSWLQEESGLSVSKDKSTGEGESNNSLIFIYGSVIQ